MGFYSDFAGCYEQVFPFRPATFAFLDRRLPPSGPILDVGCGTGHYCGALAAAGRDCLGIDLDGEMVAVAGAANPDAEFRELAMEGLADLPAGEFAGVFCIGNVLPHLSADALPDFLRRVHALLRPGGIWIFQTVNFDRFVGLDAHDFPPIEVPGEKMVFERRYRDIGTDSLRFLTRLTVAGRQRFTGEVTLHFLTSPGTAALHRAVGFKMRGHYADFAETAYEPAEAGASVFVFERPND